MTGRHALLRRLACVAATAWASAAPAQVPPLCRLEAGHPEASLYSWYTPYALGDDFVFFSAMALPSGGRDWLHVLQHCTTGQQLTVRVADYLANETLNDGVSYVFDSMRNQTAPITLQQLRDTVIGMGAVATVSEFTEQSCACETYNLRRNEEQTQ